MVKMTVNLSDTVAKALKDMALEQGVNMTEALRRAISTEKFILDANGRGAKLLVEEPDHTVKQIVIR